MQQVKRKKNNFWSLIFILLLRVFVFEPYIVPSESMSRTMENGDIVIGTKWDYGFSRLSIPIIGQFLPFWKNKIFVTNPKRGDIVCFSLDNEHAKLYTKRVIGVAGDAVQLKNGVIHINHVPVNLEYKGEYVLRHDNNKSEIMDVMQVVLPNQKKYETLRKKYANLTYMNVLSDNTEEFIVPKDHVFCMGDNMHYSYDCRFFGFAQSIPCKNIVARPRFVIFGSTSRIPYENNWIKWIFRLPYSVLYSIVHPNWGRIGKII
ncbi:MAG: signal peptidase I [Alphaproteobacteria bacterium]|nr:MAG: signal peptidase I [Alphaproteobacteria bacterium]